MDDLPQEHQKMIITPYIEEICTMYFPINQNFQTYFDNIDNIFEYQHRKTYPAGHSIPPQKSKSQKNAVNNQFNILNKIDLTAAICISDKYDCASTNKFLLLNELTLFAYKTRTNCRIWNDTNSDITNLPLSNYFQSIKDPEHKKTYYDRLVSAWNNLNTPLYINRCIYKELSTIFISPLNGYSVTHLTETTPNLQSFLDGYPAHNFGKAEKSRYYRNQPHQEMDHSPLYIINTIQYGITTAPNMGTMTSGLTYTNDYFLIKEYYYNDKALSTTTHQKFNDLTEYILYPTFPTKGKTFIEQLFIIYLINNIDYRFNVYHEHFFRYPITNQQIYLKKLLKSLCFDNLTQEIYTSIIDNNIIDETLTRRLPVQLKTLLHHIKLYKYTYLITTSVFFTSILFLAEKQMPTIFNICISLFMSIVVVISLYEKTRDKDWYQGSQQVALRVPHLTNAKAIITTNLYKN